MRKWIVLFLLLFLFVPFTYGKKGTAVITVVSEKPLTEDNLANEFAGLRTLDTVHETGYIGMELNTSAEVKIAKSTGLETIAAQKLPASLYNKSARPLMYAFKYAKQPFALSFDTKKHDKVAVPVAAINSANVVTLFTEDGLFREKGGPTKPTVQDVDLTNYQIVTDLNALQVWLKIPRKGDWRQIDLKALFAG